MNPLKTASAILILSLSIIACSPLSSTPVEEPDANFIATAVAATVAASNPEMDIQEVSSLPTEITGSPPATQNPETIPTAIDSARKPKIAFIDSGDLWIWQAESGSKPLTDSGNVVNLAISDDGLLVVFVREFDYFFHELWVIGSDGSNERRLISQEDFKAIPRSEDFFITTQLYHFDWIPGTHTLAFNTRPITEGPGFISNNDLYLVEVETGSQSQMLVPGMGGMFYYSPDLEQIALITPESISLVNADGSNQRDILNFPFIYTYSEWAYYPVPVWSADSRYLRIVIPPQDPLGNPDDPAVLYQINPDDNSATRMAEFISAPVFVGSPIISPDTLKVLYVRPISGSDNQLELHHLDIDTGIDTLYTTAAFRPGTWSPDSSRFSYLVSPSEQVNIGQLGAEPLQATDTDNAYDLRWINETHLSFYTRLSPEDQFSLRLGPAAGDSEAISGNNDIPQPYDFSK